jgi:hypothetical protein
MLMQVSLLEVPFSRSIVERPKIMKDERPYPPLLKVKSIQKGKMRAGFYLSDQICQEEFWT